MTDQRDIALAVEQRGIDLVPQSERKGRARDLIWFWAGTNTSVFAVVYGPVLIALGLSLAEAIVVIVLGNVISYAVLGLASLQGPKVGTTTMVTSRASYGPNAQRAYSFLAWVSLVGFEAIGLSLMVAATGSAFSFVGIDIGFGGSIAALVVLALAQLILPRLGYSALMVAKKWGTVVFLVAFAAIALYILPTANYDDLPRGGHVGPVFVGLMMMLASGGFSWITMGSDYTRYLPARTRSSSIWWSVVLGNCVPIIALQVLGAAVASVTPLADDPISGVPAALPSGFFLPYVVLAILTLLSVNATSIYSSGLNLQALGLKVRRSRAVFFDLVVGGVIAFFTLLAPSFESALNVFLGLLGLWIAPWGAVYLADWILRRGRYDTGSLFPTSTRRGEYWGYRGVRWQGAAAQVIGMLIGALFGAVEGVFSSPLTPMLGGMNLSLPVGFLAAGLLYVVFSIVTRPRTATLMAEEVRSA